MREMPPPFSGLGGEGGLARLALAGAGLGWGWPGAGLAWAGLAGLGWPGLGFVWGRGWFGGYLINI